MEKLFVRKVSFASPAPSIDEVEALFESENIEFHAIDKVGWPDSFPYCPDVKFRIMHSAGEIYLQYVVCQSEVRATFDFDFGSKPYTDDCVEFFIVPSDTDPTYYNMEMNCVGHGTFDYGPSRDERHHCDDSVISQIRRRSTLGEKALGKSFRIDTHKDTWRLTAAIPKSLYAQVDATLKPFSGRTLRANFYKCGDDSSRPHYLSWNPVGTPKPNFHCPEWFGELCFE